MVSNRLLFVIRLLYVRQRKLKFHLNFHCNQNRQFKTTNQPVELNKLDNCAWPHVKNVLFIQRFTFF